MVSNEEEIENMKLKISYAVLFVLICSFYAFGQKSAIQYDPKLDGLRPSETFTSTKRKSAQEDWILLENKGNVGSWYYLDRNVDVLSSGIVEYRIKNAYSFDGYSSSDEIHVVWANCVAREWMLVSAPGLNSLANVMSVLKGKWFRFNDTDHIDYASAGSVACQMVKARNEPKVSNDKKVVKKRVVKGTRKRKQ
jgi:hypothetical protein